ncbi:MAG: hypothetical protein ACK5VI_10795 [Opitutia bacterium]|jgi:hypothetical protein
MTDTAPLAEALDAVCVQHGATYTRRRDPETGQVTITLTNAIGETLAGVGPDTATALTAAVARADKVWGTP